MKKSGPSKSGQKTYLVRGFVGHPNNHTHEWIVVSYLDEEAAHLHVEYATKYSNNENPQTIIVTPNPFDKEYENCAEDFYRAKIQYEVVEIPIIDHPDQYHEA